MACSQDIESATTPTANVSYPRRLFPLERVMQTFVLQNVVYCHLQGESSSRESSPTEVDREGSPDIVETFRIRCDCKSICQRRGCPCKAASSTCGAWCKCGTTKKNPAKTNGKALSRVRICWMYSQYQLRTNLCQNVQGKRENGLFRYSNSTTQFIVILIIVLGVCNLSNAGTVPQACYWGI